MKFDPSEDRWLNAFKKALDREFPGDVQQVFVYGSRARGDCDPDSDLDVLLVVRDGAARRAVAMRQAGYLLAADGEVVPSILVYTAGEWELRRQSRSPFRRAVDRDKVRVL